MKLIIDRYIPFVKGVFDNTCQVEYLQSADIDRNTVRDADCLIVRTRTLCNEALLKGSDIKLIASATAGYEHIDLDFCKREGIATFVARGCNASSVAQYVGSAVALWTATNGLSTHDLTIGIVGYGYVGKAGVRPPFRLVERDSRQERRYHVSHAAYRRRGVCYPPSWGRRFFRSMLSQTADNKRCSRRSNKRTIDVDSTPKTTDKRLRSGLLGE